MFSFLLKLSKIADLGEDSSIGVHVSRGAGVFYRAQYTDRHDADDQRRRTSGTRSKTRFKNVMTTHRSTGLGNQGPRHLQNRPVSRIATL